MYISLPLIFILFYKKMVKRALQIPHIDTHKGYNETEPLFILDFIERHDFFHRLLPILEPVPYRVLVSNL